MYKEILDADKELSHRKNNTADTYKKAKNLFKTLDNKDASIYTVSSGLC